MCFVEILYTSMYNTMTFDMDSNVCQLVKCPVTGSDHNEYNAPGPEFQKILGKILSLA